MLPRTRIALAVALSTLIAAPLVYAQLPKVPAPSQTLQPTVIGPCSGASTCGVAGGVFTTKIQGGALGVAGTITIRPQSASWAPATASFSVPAKTTQEVQVRHSFPSQCGTTSPEIFTVDFQIPKGTITVPRRYLAVKSAQVGMVGGSHE